MSISNSGAVLILGDESDPHIVRVGQELSSRAINFLILDLWKPWSPFTVAINGAVSATKDSKALHITSVWLRWKPHVGSLAEDEAFAVRERREFLLALIELSRPRNLLNDPWKQERARNKPLQLLTAQRLGFSIPNTWISSEALELANKARTTKLVYKPLSWLATTNGEILFTNEVTEADLTSNIETIACAPGIFQQLIPKRFEYRITIVDGRVFAARIFSQERPETALDWRRNQLSVRYEAVVLPRHIENSLTALMEELGLRYGAVDMIESPSGDWIFLEVNPGGNWLWLEQAAGLPISASVADALS